MGQGMNRVAPKWMAKAVLSGTAEGEGAVGWARPRPEEGMIPVP